MVIASLFHGIFFFLEKPPQTPSIIVSIITIPPHIRTCRFLGSNNLTVISPGALDHLTGLGFLLVIWMTMTLLIYWFYMYIVYDFIMPFLWLLINSIKLHVLWINIVKDYLRVINLTGICPIIGWPHWTQICSTTAIAWRHCLKITLFYIKFQPSWFGYDLHVYFIITILIIPCNYNWTNI